MNSDDWKSISKMVTEKALPILPHIRSNKLKSEIISNLFESQSAKYFNSIGVPVQACATDREPDLFFLNEKKPVEIKVTKSDHPFTTRCKWVGGKYSKRSSDYILIVWYHTLPSLWESESTIQYFIAKTYIEENEWIPLGENYYGTAFSNENLLLKENYDILMGKRGSFDTLICE